MTVEVGAAQSDGAFTLLEWSAPSGLDRLGMCSEREDEVFCVLDGEMRVEGVGRVRMFLVLLSLHHARPQEQLEVVDRLGVRALDSSLSVGSSPAATYP